MKKILGSVLAVSFLLAGIFAQEMDDDFFFEDVDTSYTASAGSASDDDLFGDSGIDELAPESSNNSNTSHGALFDNGSIKIGGTFTTSIGLMTDLYADDDATFGEHLNDTTLTPTVNATLTLDARPTQVLRMYSKMAFGYPFNTTLTYNQTGSNSISLPEDFDPDNFDPDNFGFSSLKGPDIGALLKGAKISDFIKVKELFTDFSVNDRAFFRFGVHTVTWGTGFFFSPVSDMINTSSIDPEDTSAQVDGSLNLRTQITFKDSMNCLWLYVVPSTDFAAGSAASYFRDTAFAGKADILIKNWELGLGGYYCYDKPLKLMVTASGSIKKLGVFGETVFQYGSSEEWYDNDSWKGKSPILQFTAGVNYIWKDPSIVFAAQYYYDGNHYDKLLSIGKYSIPRITEGHNIAFITNFGKLFGSSDFNAAVFGMVNFGKEKMDDDLKTLLKNNGISIPSLITSVMFSYKPIKDFTVSAGPYIVLADFDSKPTVSLKITATLGGGKF